MLIATAREKKSKRRQTRFKAPNIRCHASQRVFERPLSIIYIDMTLGRLETCCPPSQKWHAQHEKVAAHSLLPRVQVQIAGAAVHVQQPNHMSVVKLFEKGNLTQSNGRNAILSETESFAAQFHQQETTKWGHYKHIDTDYTYAELLYLHRYV